MTDRLAVEENSEAIASDNNDENKNIKDKLLIEAELEKHRYVSVLISVLPFLYFD